VLEEMIGKLGATVRRVTAPFDPEPGAYAGETVHAHSQAGHELDHFHDHSHGHSHKHGHRHGH
jgi:urease accessory protein